MQEGIAAGVVPTGRIKSSGIFGRRYQVGQALLQLEDGDWLVEVKMVDTGEKAEYRLSSILDDPEAA
jgi:hypothetical protein